jgi:hypothetical protein
MGDAGGLTRRDGTRLLPDPILGGRDAARLRARAARAGGCSWTTDLDAALARSDVAIYFDAQTTERRADAVRRALAAGKHVYCEKPSAASLADAVDLARRARAAGVKHGVVQDKLWLPGLVALRDLRHAGFFGRLLSIRGDFGYWVFEGDLTPAQRPSWNYRLEDGGGIVRDGELYTGDNSVAGEIWILRHKYDPESNAEEGASIRAVRRSYAEMSNIPFEEAPEPKVVFDIARGLAEGNAFAAREAFRKMGEMAGDAIANANTILDALVVIGGGVSGAHSQFLPAIVNEMNSTYLAPNGERFRRLIPQAFNLQEPGQLDQFLQGATTEITVPYSSRKLRFDGLQRTGVGITRLGTSEATSIGAYAFALNQLDRSAVS